jgi:hypothetical protein
MLQPVDGQFAVGVPKVEVSIELELLFSDDGTDDLCSLNKQTDLGKESRDN